MKYTARFCHLKEYPELKVGQKIKKGQLLGIMGNTGASQAAHLHFGCIFGERSEPWRLVELEELEVIPAFRQMNYFLDDDLFNSPLLITTYVADPDYPNGKIHLEYDVVPADRLLTDSHYKIFWNRSKVGTVLSVGYDSGYGYYIHIVFEG